MFWLIFHVVLHEIQQLGYLKYKLMLKRDSPFKLSPINYTFLGTISKR